MDDKRALNASCPSWLNWRTGSLFVGRVDAPDFGEIHNFFGVLVEISIP